MLVARAKMAGGISVQRLMVTAALSDERTPSVDFETRRQAWAQACEVRNAIAALGVNMNQIARQANTDQEIPADFAPATAAVTRAMARVLEAFEAGVRIYAGTDAGSVIRHGRIADEILALHAAGLPMASALDAACWSAREWLGAEGLEEGIVSG